MDKSATDFRLSVDPDTATPLHAQITEQLRELIDQPAYRQGRLLPTEAQIASRLGVSRNTVRQAMQTLVNEGLLLRERRRGTRVIDGPIPTRLEAWASFSQEMSGKGVPFATLEQRVALRRSDAAAARFLQASEGQRLLLLERVKGLDGKPVVFFQSFFHERIGLDQHADFSRPLYELLERDYDVLAAHSQEEIGATLGSAAVQRRLGTDGRLPILTRTRRVSDLNRRPVEFSRCFYRSDRFSYQVDLSRRPL